MLEEELEEELEDELDEVTRPELEEELELDELELELDELELLEAVFVWFGPIHPVRPNASKNAPPKPSDCRLRYMIIFLPCC